VRPLAKGAAMTCSPVPVEGLGCRSWRERPAAVARATQVLRGRGEHVFSAFRVNGLVAKHTG